MGGCSHIDAAVFDYGGVLAEEGFREGVWAIARSCGLDRDAVLEAAVDLAWRTGYVVGTGAEAEFWAGLAREAGVRGAPRDLRREILSRFVFREWMFPLLDRLRAAGLALAMLSDQTNWLDELEARDNFFGRFDLVVNSYHAGRSKRDPGLFPEVAARLGAAPGRTLFIDDNPGNIDRARAAGLRTHLYVDRAGLLAALAVACPGLEGLHA